MPRGWADCSEEARLATLAFLDAQRPLLAEASARPGPAALAAAASSGPRRRSAWPASSRPSPSADAPRAAESKGVSGAESPVPVQSLSAQQVVPEHAHDIESAAKSAEAGGCAGAAFSRIYREEDWSGQLGSEAQSGLGSREDTTREFRAFLETFLRDQNISSVVDAGCGHWPSGYQQYMNWQNVRYVGLDVVPYVVEENQAYFMQDSGEAMKKHALKTSEFIVGDVCGLLPAADLLIVKDVLMHLPNASVRSFLEHSVNTKLPRYRFVMLVQNMMPMNLREMMDIEAGQLLPFDITQPPFGATSFRNVFQWQSDEMKVVQLWQSV